MITTVPIVLHQFPPAFGLPISESPPCGKVEAYFRLTGTAYVIGSGDTRRSPNKMVPYVRWPDGTFQGESGDIIARLEATKCLDAPFDLKRLERGHALAAHVEEVVYDACLYDRFVVSAGWAYQYSITLRLVTQFVPAFLAPLAVFLVRRQQIQRARRGVMSDPAHGYAVAVEAIRQVEELLGDELFLCGEQPGTVDCAIWANLVHTAATPNGSPPREAVRNSAVLLAWMLRFGEVCGLSINPAIIQNCL